MSDTDEAALEGLESIAARGRRRRRADRRVLRTPVELELEPGAVEGRTQDVSSSGMLLFASERLRVRVRFELDGREVERTGRLVRTQPMAGDEAAYAIQFDDELDLDSDRDR
jgi:hypothetical protein